MSPPRNPSNLNRASTRRAQASIFASLGDPTRLSLLAKLASGDARSIAHLTTGSRLTRQAITKHLRIMERTRIVRCTRSGRESLYTLNPKPLLELSEYLALVSAQWDQALLRLKSLAEATPPQ